MISRQEFKTLVNTATDRETMKMEVVKVEATDTPKRKKATDQQEIEDANTIQRSIPREATQTRHQVAIGET